MKKHTIIFVVMVIMLFLLVSCKSGDSSDKTLNTDNQNSSSVPEITYMGEIHGGFPSKESIVFFSSYDDYVKYIETEDVPDFFVSFDMISQFGEFDSFITLKGNRFSAYTYTAIDENGCEIRIYIKHGCTLSEGIVDNAITTASFEINESDMRYIDDNKHVYQLCINDLLYSFVQGGLNSVSWEYNNAVFTVTTVDSGKIRKYPIESKKTTAVSKLLNTETAKEFMEELSEKINSANQ